jgi:2-succinyl-6-hydroxy-2,4-cyclohexadiene-1-carboxylate synthase
MDLLHYRVAGSGEAVVFLHGFMEDTTFWDDLITVLLHKQCILIDLHGHGNSFFNPALKPSMAVMAQQVKDVLDHLGIAHYHVIGHSLGGYVGCELLKTDERVEHLTLLHSHPWPDPETKKQDRNRVIELVKTKAAQFIREAIPNLFAFPDEHREAIQRYCAIAERMDPAAIGWVSAAMRDRESSVDILSVKATSVSIIQGQLDPLIPNIQLHTFAGEHGISFYEIPRCGHMGQEEAPGTVKELLKVVIG